MRPLNAFGPAMAACLLVLSAVAAEARAGRKVAPRPAAAFHVSDTGPLSLPDLMSIAGIEMTHPAKDEFSPAPNARFAGRRFSMIKRLGPATDTDHDYDGTWSFDLQTETLSFRSEPIANFHVWYTEKPTGSYVGTNAFGVRTRIARSSAISVLLSASSLPGPRFGAYEAELTAPPEEARRIAADSGLLVEGELQAKPGQSPVSCSLNPGEPTISDPTDITTEECSFNATIDRVAFVRGPSNEVVKEWRQDSSPK